MKHSLSSKLVMKSRAAMTSAIEVYNRPSFSYREETFAILALNAWELLLKAKILRDAGNKPQAIWVYQTVTLKGGKQSKRPRPVLNRARNKATISIAECLKRLATIPKPID